MTMVYKNDLNKGEIVIYKTPGNQVKIEVKLKEDTVWLTQAQIANLFGTQRPAITKHLNNIFKSKELSRNSVCSFLEHTASDSKTYKTAFYNLDAIISVGYRVNSNRATQFRIWATKTLKEHLVKGYTVNEKLLLKRTGQLQDLQKTISFLQNKSENKLLKEQTQTILKLLEEYAKSLTLLDEYDKNKIKLVKGKKPKYELKYDECLEIIEGIKNKLIEKKEASYMFGNEVNKKLESIIGSLYQTFDGHELYDGIDEKAAHLLYLVIKDHPFTDGNKRIASMLFVYFLEKNSQSYKESREKKINDNALVTLSLLIAISEPKEKDTMIKIITNLLCP